jgi:hypothetical protein
VTWQTTAAAAVDGLVAAAKTVEVASGVFDSLVLGNDADIEAIVVAGSLGRVDTARQETNVEWIEHQLEAPGYNLNQMDTFVISSEIGVINGDADMSTARSRAYAILSGWGTAIEADVTLGGAVDHAWISYVGWKPRIETNGVIAILRVRVSCEAFTGA